MMRPVLALLALAWAAAAVPSRAAELSVVAAENFYGDVARQVAGPDVQVSSILGNPDQDPHLFEASASVARALAHARIVIYSGADYDTWMARLLAASRVAGRREIVVAELVHRRAGDNPHVWYDPAAMIAAGQALAEALGAADPARAADYARRQAAFAASLAPLQARIAALRARFHGAPVTATEPVFGYMADALGLDMRNQRFQTAVMNETEPAASDIVAFERDLRERRVRLLIHNRQAASGAAARLMRIAEASGVPVVGVTETQPDGLGYREWMLRQLDAVAAALDRPAP